MVDGPTLTAELLEYADAIDKDRGRRTGVTVTMREAADALAALLARAEAAEKALARTRGMLRDAMAFVDPEVAGDWKLWLDEIGVAGSSPVDSGVEGGAGTASRGRALLAGDSGGRLLDREASGASSSSSPAAEAETCRCGAAADDISFDRSICACGAMHYYCNSCGTQAEPCGAGGVSGSSEALRSSPGNHVFEEIARDDSNGENA